MNNEQQAELERLERVLAVAKRNGNELFIQNIERGDQRRSAGVNTPPLIEEYLTAAERASRGRRQPARGLKPTERHAIPTIDRSGPQGNAP